MWSAAELGRRARGAQVIGDDVGAAEAARLGQVGRLPNARPARLSGCASGWRLLAWGSGACLGVPCRSLDTVGSAPRRRPTRGQCATAGRRGWQRSPPRCSAVACCARARRRRSRARSGAGCGAGHAPPRWPLAKLRADRPRARPSVYRLPTLTPARRRQQPEPTTLEPSSRPSRSGGEETARGVGR